MATFIEPKFIKQTIDYDHIVYKWQPKMDIVEKSFLWWTWKSRNFKKDWIAQNDYKVEKHSKTYHNDIFDFDHVSSFRPITSHRWAMSPFEFRSYTLNSKPGSAARATYGHTWNLLTDPDEMLHLIEINIMVPELKKYYWYFESEINQKLAFEDLINQIQYRSPE